MNVRPFSEQLEIYCRDIFENLILPVESSNEFWNNIAYIRKELKIYNSMPGKNLYIEHIEKHNPRLKNKLKSEEIRDLLESRNQTLRLIELEKLCANIWSSPSEYINANSGVTSEDLYNAWAEIPWNTDLSLLLRQKDLEKIDRRILVLVTSQL